MDQDKHDEQKINKKERRKFILENETSRQRKRRLEEKAQRQQTKIDQETPEEKKRRLEKKKRTPTNKD